MVHNPCAAQRLPNLDQVPRDEAVGTLAAAGFESTARTPGEYERWRHPDGSNVWIRPNGEIVRVPGARAVAEAGLSGKGWRVDPRGNIVRPHTYTPENVRA